MEYLAEHLVSFVVMVVGGLGVIFGIVIVVLLRGRIESRSYEGKAVFNTIGEYRKFKRMLGDKGVRWFEADALSSEPPIVVQFSAQAEPDFEFPYGEMTVNTELDMFGWHQIGLGLGGFLLLCGTIVMLFT